MDDPGNQPELRISDADRERVAAELREHAAAGRLTVEELSERLDAALAAKTGGELAELTRDLPAAPAPATQGLPERRWTVAVMSGNSRRGRWRAARKTRALAVMGGVDLDLRDAEFDGNVLEVSAVAVMGGIDVIVPEGVDVQFEELALLGGNDLKGDPGRPQPGAPVIRVRAFSLMGGVDVVVRPRPA